MDTKTALENLSKLKLYKYDFIPEFSNGGLKSDYGIYKLILYIFQ